MLLSEQEAPVAAARSLRILVVGAGPVGHILAESLCIAGFSLRHWARSRGPLWEEGADKRAVDVVILAVRDEAIAQAARYVVEHGAADAQSVLLHCAGALPPLEVLGEEVNRVKGRGLLHPLRSFVEGNEGEDAVPSLKGTVIGIGGDDAGQAMAQHLCEALGGIALPLSPDQQGAYHAAAVMAAGHVASLIDVAAHVLASVGLHRSLGEPALAALTGSVVKNIIRVGLPAAFTGPFARGEATTVERHLAALKNLSAESEAVYRDLAPSAIDLGYRKAAATAESLDRVADVIFKRNK